jgi:hypothetical protein
MSVVCLTALRIFVGPELKGWWRDNFGDPVFRVIARIVVLTAGDAARLIFVCSLGLALFLWVVRILQAALTRASLFRFRGTSPQSVAVDSVHDQLRQMFSDDPEQVALYESRLLDTQKKVRPRRPLLIGGMGCALSIIWAAISMPLSFLVTLAVFDSLHRLFDAYRAARAIEQSTGPLFMMLNQFLPLEKTVFGIDLMGRSALLCVALALLAALHWFVGTTPIVKIMWPTGISRSAWISFLMGISLLYALANALVLWVMLTVLAFNLISLSAGRFIFRPLRLNAGALWIRMRNRRRDQPVMPASESSSKV